MSNKTEYDTILALARKSNFKKIMIIRDSWNTGNWCIVNSIEIKPDGEQCKPSGYIKYSNVYAVLALESIIVRLRRCTIILLGRLCRLFIRIILI